MARATKVHYPRKGNRTLHRVIAERALGHSIPLTAQVHHVNEDKADPSPGNLVLCNDAAYHKLLHLRQRALDACGNANWLRCKMCKQYDEPANLTIPRRTGKWSLPYHRECCRIRSLVRYNSNPDLARSHANRSYRRKLERRALTEGVTQ